MKFLTEHVSMDFKKSCTIYIFTENGKSLTGPGARKNTLKILGIAKDENGNITEHNFDDAIQADTFAEEWVK
jgi:hypothetical protein